MSDELEQNAPDEHGRTDADERPHHINEECATAISRREAVCQDRAGGWRQTCLTGSHHHPGDEKPCEVRCQPASDSGEAPHGHSDCEDSPSAMSVDHAPYKKAHGREKENKREAVEQTDLSVAEMQVGADRDDEKRYDLAIEKAEQTGEEDRPDNVIATGAIRIGYASMSWTGDITCHFCFLLRDIFHTSWEAQFCFSQMMMGEGAAAQAPYLGGYTIGRAHV